MATTGVKQYKYSILTFVFGEYEKLHEIEGMDSEVEYVCVTDNENLQSDTWKIIIDSELDGKGVFDKCFSVRYNPFKYVKSDVCVRVDGSICIHKSLTPIVNKFIESDCDACFMLHPYRNNLITEYNTWIKCRNFSIERAKEHINFLGGLGYDFNKKGMLEIGFNIVKNTKINNELNGMMYRIQKYLGDEKDVDRLDQTVVTGIIGVFFPDMKIFAVGESIIHSEYMTWCYHNSDEEVPYAPSMVLKPHLFGKEVILNDF